MWEVFDPIDGQPRVTVPWRWLAVLIQRVMYPRSRLRPTTRGAVKVGRGIRPSSLLTAGSSAGTRWAEGEATPVPMPSQRRPSVEVTPQIGSDYKNRISSQIL